MPRPRRQSSPPPERLTLDHRLRERIADHMMRAVVRTIGLRHFLLPTSVLDQLAYMGLRGSGFVGALAQIRSLTDWPYVWEAEGDKFAADDDWLTASVLYYLAQRVIVRPTPLKERLYKTSQRAYWRIDHPVPLEDFRVRHAHHMIAGLLQVPAPRRKREELPLVVMIPGVTATKEEMHKFSDAMVRRRYAVCRIDNPGYGDTTGPLTFETRHMAATVAEQLADDPRIDRHRIHFFGMSMGGHWALHGATEFPAASLTTVSAPFTPHNFVPSLPTPYLQALHHTVGGGSPEALFSLIRDFDLAPIADRLTLPTRAFHGGRDNVVPPSEMYRLARTLDLNSVATLFRDEYHTCLGVADRMLAETLVWMGDPTGRLTLARRRRRALRGSVPFRRLGAPVLIHEPGSLIQTAARLDGSY